MSISLFLPSVNLYKYLQAGCASLTLWAIKDNNMALPKSDEELSDSNDEKDTDVVSNGEPMPKTPCTKIKSKFTSSSSTLSDSSSFPVK